MYLGLFLTPWILLYALSSLVFNHIGAIRGWYGEDFNRFEKASELEYQAPFERGTSPTEAAKRILADLGMAGAHFTQGSLDGERFTVVRLLPFGNKRVIYFPKQGHIVIERQIANAPNFLTRMHTAHGYEQEDTAAKVWGLGVELTVLTMLFWIASGLWLWWEIKPARKWGAAFACAGFGIFAIMLFAI